MTTISKIDDTWVDIKADLTLTPGVDYLIQNTGANLIYLREDAVQPGATVDGHIIKANAAWTFQIGALPMWVRSSTIDGEFTLSES